MSSDDTAANTTDDTATNTTDDSTDVQYAPAQHQIAQPAEGDTVFRPVRPALDFEVRRFSVLATDDRTQLTIACSAKDAAERLARLRMNKRW